MRILVTNDDGVDSPGIHALPRALVAGGHDALGATLTGAEYGIPGIAVSMEWSQTKEYHWDTAARIAAAAVEWAAKPDGDPRVLNINVPNCELGDVRGVREAELAPAGEVWVASA